MSRLGKIPIPIPKGVEVKWNAAQGQVSFKGPKGTAQENLPKGLSVEIKEELLFVVRDEKILSSNAVYGLYRSLVKNWIEGVFKKFEKKLQLVGVGFRVAEKGKFLDLKVGFSHPTEVPIPPGIEVKIDKGTEMVISGLNKQVVGQFAATVRALKKPEPYKGKGIRYVDEYVRKKAGKAAKATK